MPLPNKKTPEWQILAEKWKQTYDQVERAKLGETFGYSSLPSFDKRMNERGIFRAQPLAGEPERKPIITLPPVNLLPYKTDKRKRGDEEIAILHASDGHADKITKSFNKEIYKERMARMFESAMTIVNLHRHMYPIRKLIIADTGDNVQGENPFQGSKVGDISMGVRDQVSLLAAPMWNDVIGSFRQEFDEVEFHGLPGNHGHDRLAPETSRADLMLYDILKAGIGKEKGISINIHEDWYYILDEFGFLMFLFHGDGIPCQQGVPFFALDKKLKSWYMQFGGFNYALGGHFHKRHADEISSRLEYFMAASLTSDDEWALKKLGISSNPSQGLYGLHPQRGITWRYALQVDPKFKPEKLPQEQTNGE